MQHSTIIPAARHGASHATDGSELARTVTRPRGYDAPTVNSARLHNDLRTAQREWQGFAMFDAWPGQPWADERDAAAARIASLKAQIAATERFA